MNTTGLNALALNPISLAESIRLSFLNHFPIFQVTEAMELLCSMKIKLPAIFLFVITKRLN